MRSRALSIPAAARSASRFSDPIFRAARRRAASSSRRGSKLIDSCSGSVLENGDDLALLDELVLGDQHHANRASIVGEDGDLHLHALDVDDGLARLHPVADLGNDLAHGPGYLGSRLELGQPALLPATSKSWQRRYPTAPAIATGRAGNT